MLSLMIPCHPIAGLYATEPKATSRAYIVDDFGNAIDVLACSQLQGQWVERICELVRVEH